MSREEESGMPEAVQSEHTKRKTFKDLTPEQQELVRKRRKEKKLGEPGDAEGEERRKTTGKKKRRKQRTELVAGELERVEFDRLPDSNDVKPVAGKHRRTEREAEDALASLEDQRAHPKVAAGSSTEEVIDLNDSSDQMEQLLQADGEELAPAGPEPRPTSRKAGRMKASDDAPQKKAHPGFIAAIIGIPAILVALMAWHKFGGAGGGGGQAPVDQPPTKVERHGSQVEWEKAEEQAAEAKEMYQKAVRAWSAAEEAAPGGKVEDKGPHIDRFEKARALILTSLDSCKKMLEVYKKEQKKKSPKISDGELERKLRRSRYGARQADWETTRKDIEYRLKKLRGAGESHGGSSGK